MKSFVLQNTHTSLVLWGIYNMTTTDRIVGALKGGRIMKYSDLCAAACCKTIELSRVLGMKDSPIEPFAGGFRLAGPQAPDTDEAYAELALRYPEGVLCLIGAARWWDMTDFTRDQMKDSVLLPFTAGGNRGDKFSSVKIIRTRNPQLLTEEVIRCEIAPELFLRVTTAERTICDLFAADESKIKGVEALSRWLSAADDVDSACSALLLTAANLGRSVEEIDFAVQTVKGASTWNENR
jgi:hypothetical protein